MNYTATMIAAAFNLGLTYDEITGPLQVAHTKLLAAAARGEVDLNQLAKVELASRGLDKAGQWVGFARAAEIHDIEAPERQVSA